MLQVNLAEIIIKTVSNNIILSSMLTNSSKTKMLENLGEFRILQDEIKEDKIGKYKEIKSGSFERIMSIFGGIK